MDKEIKRCGGCKHHIKGIGCVHIREGEAATTKRRSVSEACDHFEEQRDGKELKAIITVSGRTDSDQVEASISFEPALPGAANDEPNPHKDNPTIANLAIRGFEAISAALKADAEEDA